MLSGVACRAKRNQILLRVVAGVAAKFFVVDFEVGHTTDIGNRRDAAPGCGAVRTVRNQAASEAASVGPNSRRFLGDVMQECLPLFAGKELEKS
jgi:hypothetical protein